MIMRNTAYIGLGSNLDDPENHVLRGLRDINTLEHCNVTKVSQLYRSRAIGPGVQDDYINAACQIVTHLPAVTLLKHLQAIEHQHDRVRIVRWGPRTLDLDILLFNQDTIHTPQLSVPHPRIAERAFVLNPLYDLNPQLIFPDGTTLEELHSQIQQDGLDVHSPAPTME